MLHFQMDMATGVPVYRQLMEQIRHYVASGVLAAGDQLPSIRELARALAVNPATVVKTFNELAHEGVVEIQHGKGAFVAASLPKWPAARRLERLTALANQLAVEARQMGADDHEVNEVIRQALEQFPPQGESKTNQEL
jgi:GntR family transcriptional regulator